MEDKFKFRVWDNNNQDYLDDEDTIYLTNQGELVVIGEGPDGENCFEDTTDCEIELWTGATDDNDNPIYTGDIIKVVEFDEDSVLGEIFERIEAVHLGGYYYDYCFTTNCNGKHNLLCNELDRALNIIEVEVVGNIHENPELLEKENAVQK